MIDDFRRKNTSELRELAIANKASIGYGESGRRGDMAMGQYLYKGAEEAVKLRSALVTVSGGTLGGERRGRGTSDQLNLTTLDPTACSWILPLDLTPCI